VLKRFDGVVDEAVRSGVETVAIVSHRVAIRGLARARAVDLTVQDVRERELDTPSVS
jgi:broad specificity phosphatase PhoE